MEGESKIRFLSGPITEKTVTIQKPEITIGRDQQNDICVPDPKVSRRHARIYRQADSWMIENLSQSSYVTVNQQRIQQIVLQDNTIVKLGENTSFVFVNQPPAADPANVPRQSPFSLGGEVPKPQVAPETPPVRRAPTIPSNVSPTGTVLYSPAEVGVPSLAISSNIHSNVQRYPLGKSIINIGRDPDNDIALAEAIISGRHAQIVREGSSLFLVHPHPSRDKTLNGVWYQGTLVRGDQPFRKQLAHGDIFRIGNEYGTFVTFVYDDGSGASTEKLPEMPPIALTTGRLTIGRAPDNAVVLNNLQVSAHHAVLEKVESGYRILDNNSTNHVYVNGEKVTDQMLRTGDEIRIGPFRFTYTGTELKQYDESNHIRIDARNLKKFGDKQKILLNNITLTIPPRKFVALVGGSGAGKSTLMDALNGLRPAQEGTVLYNGVDYYRNLAAFNTQLGYVPQENIVHRELTVKRALYYAARLRLPSDLTREQIQWRINEVLEDVEMTDRRDLVVSKLSGGQLKRVSIALELLANPSVFFLDEPTSGLDPGLDRKMMALLRRLADRGRTIVLVTHATNNITSCDYVCFLARGGHLAYFGPPNGAKEYFDKPDFAEIYSELEPTKEQPDIPAQAEARFRASPDYQKYVASQLSERPAPQAQQPKMKAEQNRQQSRRGRGLLQFQLLATRYIELLKNDTGNLLVLLLQAPVIAILLVALVHIQMGGGIFNPDKVVQCQIQAIDPNTSKAELTIPPAQQGQTTIDCNKVITFLKDAQKAKDGENLQKAQAATAQKTQAAQATSDAAALQKAKEEGLVAEDNAKRADQQNQDAKALIKKRGGINEALQDFLTPFYGADAQKILLVMSFISVFFGYSNGFREIVKEDAIYRRERAVNLGIAPYMFSKIIVLGVFCLVQSAIVVGVVQVGEPLQSAPGVFLHPILETYITLALASLAGLMTGLVISAVAPNNNVATSFLPIVMVPQLLLAGAIIPLTDIPSQVLSMFFPTRWAMIALGSSIGLHSNPLGKDHLFQDDESYHSTLFSIYSQTDATHRLILAWIGLGAIIIALTIVVAIFLKRKDVKA
jgi:ABC-type multidrug transport system ATPase subunit/pSer/pThr/pTyr-binding forkhead associated (FHA) protein